MGMTSDSISCDYPQEDCCLASDYEDMLYKLRAQLAERDKTIERCRAALREAMEWDGLTCPEDIPPGAVRFCKSALKGNADE